jgi:hypothetical protein
VGQIPSLAEIELAERAELQLFPASIKARRGVGPSVFRQSAGAIQNGDADDAPKMS